MLRWTSVSRLSRHRLSSPSPTSSSSLSLSSSSSSSSLPVSTNCISSECFSKMKLWVSRHRFCGCHCALGDLRKVVFWRREYIKAFILNQIKINKTDTIRLTPTTIVNFNFERHLEMEKTICALVAIRTGILKIRMTTSDEICLSKL